MVMQNRLLHWSNAADSRNVLLADPSAAIVALVLCKNKLGTDEQDGLA
jgi:hypothetical protein